MTVGELPTASALIKERGWSYRIYIMYNMYRG
jgi:hypothetical protein